MLIIKEALLDCRRFFSCAADEKEFVGFVFTEQSGEPFHPWVFRVFGLNPSSANPMSVSNSAWPSAWASSVGLKTGVGQAWEIR